MDGVFTCVGWHVCRMNIYVYHLPQIHACVFVRAIVEFLLDPCSECR